MDVKHSPNIQTAREKAQTLRQELKAWEGAFRKAHDGRKPGRHDIKADREIASKYKAYNHLRAIVDLQDANPSSSSSPPQQEPSQKRNAHEACQNDAQQHQNAALTQSTPSKQIVQSSQFDIYESPSTARNLFTPTNSKRTVGPTPQKDGQVLGLFDLSSSRPPSKDRAPDQTPSKRKLSTIEEDHDLETQIQTPSSKKTKMDENIDLQASDFQTPSKTTSKLLFTTPSFLRRSNQIASVADENSGSLSPIAVNMPRKPFLKSLSTIMQDLRHMEEEKLDEDLDVLRELEADAQNNSSKSFLKKQPDNVSIEDVENAYEGELDADIEQDQRRTRFWRKKGQKRQTKRFILRPVQTRVARPLDTVDEGDDECHEAGTVPAVQFGNTSAGHSEECHKSEIGEENVDPDALGDSLPSKNHLEVRIPAQGAEKNKNDPKQEATATTKGKMLKAVRKISATAHANYKALKIHNRGSKGRGRFWRGRK